MQHITSVSLSGFKGRTVTHSFQSGVNLVVGANGSGKTSILDAIAFATTGRVPGLPKQNGPLMACIGSGVSVSASVAIEGVGTLSRSLTRSGKSVKAKQEGVEADAIAPLRLDLRPFLDGNDRERCAMILAACPESQADKLAVALRESGMTGVIPPKLHQVRGGADLPTWLADVQEAAADCQKELNATYKTLVETVRGMTLLDDDDTPTAEDPTALRGQVSAMEMDLARLEGRIQSVRQEQRPRDPHVERPTSSAAVYEAQRQEAEAAKLMWMERRGMAGQKGKSIATIQAEIAEALQYLEIYRATIGDSTEPVLREEFQKLSREMERNKAVIDSLESATENADSLCDNTECPTCGAKKEHWRTFDADAAKAKARELQDLVDQQWERSLEIENILTAIRDKADTESTLERKRAMLVDFESCPWTVAECDDQIEAINERIHDLTAALSDLKAWEMHDERVKEWEARQTSATMLEGQCADKRRELLELRPRLASMELAWNAAQDALAKTRAAKQALERQEEVKTRLDAIIESRTSWDVAVTEIMDTSMRALLDVCEVFTAGLFESPLTIKDLELGRFEGHVWVPLDSFCGSDQRIAHAAVQSALSSRHQGIKLAVVDEFGVVDPERKPRVLANLVNACERGIIHQAIVMDNRPTDGLPAGVNVISL